MRPQRNTKYTGGFDHSTPEFYKGGGTPQPTDPMKEAQAQILVENQRAANAQAEADRQEQKKAAQEEALKQQVAGQINTAYQNAQGYGSNRLSSMGLNDQWGILDAYNAELNNRKSTIGPTDTAGASTLDGSSIWDEIYGQQQGLWRGKNKRSLDEFAGTGFENNLIADTDDDAILNSILGGQYDEGLASLTRARDRGQINSTGYDTALAGLGKQKSAGMSKLSELGLGVIGTDRDKLRDLASGYYDRASNYDFGDNFDTNAMRNELTGKATGYKGSLEGDILNALGDTNYFDTNTLLGKAGMAQGAQNTAGKTSNPLAAAFTASASDDEEKKRTLGNTGLL